MARHQGHRLTAIPGLRMLIAGHGLRALAARAAAAPLIANVAVLTALLAVALVAVVLVLAVLVSISAGSVSVGTTCHANGRGAGAIPSQYLALYDQAARRYQLGSQGPSILASIHRTESDFGNNMGPSVAGAIGHMQFMPATWRAWGIDADGDGTKDPFDPEDAIHGAARYLSASGAPADWRRALFAYNHADWYVNQILDGAEGIEGICEATGAPISGDLGRLPARSLERLVAAATLVDRRRYPYCWGGGHAPTPGPSAGSYCRSAGGAKRHGSAERGLDCSGAVRWLLVLAGYRDPGAIASGAFSSSYPSGRGRAVTIWANPGHVFVEIHGRGFWGTTQANYRHGPGWVRSYPTAGFTPVHLPGL